jgi:hypothetical protein
VAGPVLVGPDAEIVVACDVVKVSCATVSAVLPEVVDPLVWNAAPV